ncbi:MAG: hypothetical protein HRT64_13975 [Erythrobacter sp.]|nr:hypothetical protein [Erythrobacter sp.]
MTNTTTNAPLAGKNVVITDRKQEGIDAALAQLGDGASGFVADSISIADLTALAAFAKGAPASRLRSPKSRCSRARTKPALSPQRITWPMAAG